MPKKLTIGLASIAALALVLSAVALAATSASTHVTATLNAKQEVPKPSVKSPSGTGKFTGTLTGNKLSWKLTFSKLSGKANAAHIHLGARGKAGDVALALCGPCKSGVSGKATLTASQKKSLLAGGTYVNVHTAKNPNGEIRGQIVRGM